MPKLDTPIQDLLETHGAADLKFDIRTSGVAHWRGGIVDGDERTTLDVCIGTLPGGAVLFFYSKGHGPSMGKRRYIFADPKRVNNEIGRLLNAMRKAQIQRENKEGLRLRG